MDKSLVVRPSDAIVYGPRFVQLYSLFKSSITKPIDSNNHLMVLCVDNLIDYCKWARSNAEQTLYISNVMEGHECLRTELRNAQKSTCTEGADMFSILQDTEQGMGIINKYALKIYSDPFYYFTFLKCCITALIEAGAIPDNERQNQPRARRAKPRKIENQDELKCFSAIRGVLLTLLKNNDVERAKDMVAKMAIYWESNAKNLRFRRFASVIPFLGQAHAGGGALERLLSINIHALQDEDAVEEDNNDESNEDPNDNDDNDDDCFNTFDQLLHQDSSEVQAEVPTAMAKEFVKPDEIAAADAIMRKKSKPNSKTAIRALRFEKIGIGTWDVKDTAIFDIDAMLAAEFNGSHEVNLINDGMLQQYNNCLTSGRFIRDCTMTGCGQESLTYQLRRLGEGVVIATWPADCFNQLGHFAHMCLTIESNAEQLDQTSFVSCNLLQHYNISNASSFLSSSLQQLPRGVLVYETVHRVGLIVRKCEALGLHEDVWTLVYPEDLRPQQAHRTSHSHASSNTTGGLTTTMGCFLCDLFPKISRLKDALANPASFENWSLLYCAHHGTGRHVDIPAPPANLSMYRTVGNISNPMDQVIERIDPRPWFHDFSFTLNQ